MNFNRPGFLLAAGFLLAVILIFSVQKSYAAGPGLLVLSKEPLKGQALNVENTFMAASQKYNVPIEILRAIGWVESHWDMRSGQESSDHAYGVMGLRSSEWSKSLDRSIAVSGFNAENVKTDLQSNVFAGAALLADIAKQQNISGRDLESWAPAVVGYEELTDPKLADIAVQLIYGAILNGMGRSFPDGSILAIAPIKISVDRARSFIKK